MYRSAMYQLNGKLEILTATFSQVAQKPRVVEEEPISQHHNLLSRNSDPRTDPFDQTLYPTVHGRRIQTKTSLTSVEAGLGALTLRSTSTTILDQDNDPEDRRNESLTRKSFVVNFLWRFASCRRGFRISTTNTFDSWSFNTIRKQPTDSQIFKLCKIGDTLGVRELLSYGRASVFDVDDTGATPLHVRTQNLCKVDHELTVTVRL